MTGISTDDSVLPSDDDLRGAGAALSSPGFRCIRCAHVLPQGDAVTGTDCPECGFAYRVGPGFIKYDADPLLFENYRNKFLLYKVLSNNGYVAYHSLAESSLAFEDRDDVRQFRSYIQKAVPQGRLLDIGCGILPLPGYLAFDDMSPYELYGLDPIEETRFQGVRIIGCAEYLPFADDSFDAIVFGGSFDHVCSPEKTATEVLRVLRPGGRVVMFMSDRSETLIAKAISRLKTVARNALRGYRTDRYIVYDNLEVFYSPPGAVDAFHSFRETPRYVIKLMQSAGLRHDDLDYTHRNQVFLVFTKPEK